MLTVRDWVCFALIPLVLGCTAAFLCRVRAVKILFWAIVYGYGAAVAAVTLFPLPLRCAESITPVPGNAVPFRTIAYILQNCSGEEILLQIGGNVLLTVPYGFCLGRCVRGSNRRRLLALLPWVLPTVIEGTQLCIGLMLGVQYRSADIDDILLNALGGYAGILLHAFFKRSARHIKSKTETK